MAIANQRRALYYYIAQCNTSLQNSIQQICSQQLNDLTAESLLTWPLELLTFACESHTECRLPVKSPYWSMLTRHVDNVGQTHTRQQCIKWLLHPQHKSFHQLFVERRLNTRKSMSCQWHDRRGKPLDNGPKEPLLMRCWMSRMSAFTYKALWMLPGNVPTIYFCALLDVAALNVFLDVLHASSNSINLRDGGWSEGCLWQCAYHDIGSVM